MIICSVNSVSKMYGGNPIFDNLSFEINEGEKVGLVGRNGSGKTTLIQLLSGKETPDNGQIHWKKGTTIGYLEQIPTTDPALTVKDVLKQAFRELLKTEEKMKQIEYSMSEETEPKQLDRLMNEYGNLLDFFTIHGGYEMEANIDKIVHGLKLHHMVDQTFATLSGGEKTKIGLAHILLKHPDFLLLDEPTNHLDLMAVEWLGEFLKNYQGTVLIISHDRYFLDEVVNKILDLEDGEIKCYHTDFTGYVKEKQEQLLRDFQAYEEQQKKIKKMKEAIKRLKEWANSANPPNEGLHKRARNMERALERMEKLNRPNMNPKKINLEMESAARSGKDVVSVHNVEKRFGEMILFTNVNLEVKYKERVAIVGENGSGKSTLIKMILEQVQPDYGEIRLGSNVKIGYLSQHVFADSKDVTVLDKFRENVRVTEGEARNILSRFLFFGHAVFRKISKLSGGEKMRLRLAELMHQEINFLVLDEPTNHLDIESREVLEDALEEFDGTILAVSHDRYFLNKLFEKIYWIDSNQVYMFNGDYNWAKKKMGEFQQNNRRKEEKQNTKAPLILAKSDEKRPRQEESKNIIKKIEVIGERILEIEGKLSATKNLNVLQQLFKEKVELEEKWEELFSQLDA